MRQSLHSRTLICLATILLSSPAAAKPLYSVWTAQPVGQTGKLEAEFGKPFLVQRILPYRLVRLSAEAVIDQKKTLSPQTHLVAVYQRDGKSAYCTVKDHSLGNVSKSFFIPALDKRPCLVDSDNDGQFEASFGAFDKYGSALTPSGNLSSAAPLVRPVPYEQLDPAQFPFVRQLDYALSGPKEAAKARIEVRFDNGSGFVRMQNQTKPVAPGSPAALNVVATIGTVNGDRAQIDVRVNPDLVIVGESGGTFGADPLPEFVPKVN